MLPIKAEVLHGGETCALAPVIDGFSRWLAGLGKASFKSERSGSGMERVKGRTSSEVMVMLVVSV